MAVGSKVLSFPGSFMAASSCSLSHSLIYRVSHPIIHRGSSAKFLGGPLACGPLLQLATAQARQGNSLKIIRKTSLHDGMGNSVEREGTVKLKRCYVQSPQSAGGVGFFSQFSAISSHSVKCGR